MAGYLPKSTGFVRDNGLCIGCGFCAACCPSKSIQMRWQRGLWVPYIDQNSCTECSDCLRVCPNTPECICQYALTASHNGGRYFGLHGDVSCFVGYDLDNSRRTKSASGGIATALLQFLLEKKYIDGVIASVPCVSSIGEPHYRISLLSSIDELDKARSSHYQPLCYTEVLEQVAGRPGRYALVGVPCIIRGARRLPKAVRTRIKFAVGLACTHNVTGEFVDYIAAHNGVVKGEAFYVNQRDKIGITTVHGYNTLLQLKERALRVSSLKNSWQRMFVNCFFTPECCLYCPDFYAADADVTLKDAWGRWTEPTGTSMVISRNSDLTAVLEKMRSEGIVRLQPCSVEEVLSAQVQMPKFRQEEAISRLAWKTPLKVQLKKKGHRVPARSKWLNRAVVKYWELRLTSHFSKLLYDRINFIPIRTVIVLSQPISITTQYPGVLIRRMLRWIDVICARK